MIHKKVSTGLCNVCRHYGDDCEGVADGIDCSSFRPDNLFGNVIGVIADRSGIGTDEVIARIVATFDTDNGDDFDMAESVLWDRFFGPLCDAIMDFANIDWAW